MAGFTNLSEYVNSLSGGSSGNPQNLFWFKQPRVLGVAAVAPVAGRITSLWQYEGNPAHGAIPGVVAAPTNATDGALKQADPSGGRKLWLTNFQPSSFSGGAFFLYDRLLHIGGFSGTNTGAQAVGGALTRYTNGLGNQIMVEIYTAIGGSSTTITASYTNQDGNPATTQATGIGNTNLREAQRMIILPLASGDTGVQGVTSVTLAATTGGVGNFGVTIAHPIARCQSAVSGNAGMSSLLTRGNGPVEVLTGACVALYFLSASNVAPDTMSPISLVER